MNGLRGVDWNLLRQDFRLMFARLIRTKVASTGDQEIPAPNGANRLTRCLTTMDLMSLGVGSCVGTGMYLVAGMVAKNYAGPGVIISFVIAALASIFSGACYAEFGVRVPDTTGSAYSYTYVAVGEFIAFIIGWNMALEYMIGTSACARALSASIDSILDGSISSTTSAHVGNFFGEPPDVLAFAITVGMTLVLIAGVKKSIFFTNLLNIINLCVWVFIIGAGMFYIDFNNWTDHGGFMPHGWSGVLSGAATCFYAFIGFDIIATTGEEAQSPKRSIPLAILYSLVVILVAYVSTSFILTLVVPYDQLDRDSALVQMFSHVDAPTCKYIVAIGALAGLTVSMFGSMFPLPRILYAMSLDGLIYGYLSTVSETTGTPAFAAMSGGSIAALMALLLKLEILVEMMSIGTLLAYTLVSTCVLVLRYQPHATNLLELLPESIRTTRPQSDARREIVAFANPANHLTVRRVARSSPDSDESIMGDDDDDGRDDTFLVDSTENNYYVPGASCNPSRFGRFVESVSRRFHAMSYLCPGFFPWVDVGPPTRDSGVYVVKAVGVMYVLIIIVDMIAAYGNPGTCTATAVFISLLLISILMITVLISRRPQNRVGLAYVAPFVPFVPSMAIMVNIYLILNLSILTLVRFTIWMALGIFVYFNYGIKNSKLETNPPAIPPPPPNPLDRSTIPPSPRQARTTGDRNIFEGDGASRFYGQPDTSLFANQPDNTDSLLTWHTEELVPVQSSSRNTSGTSTSYKQVETRFNTRTNTTSSHTSSRPPWAYPDATYDTWDD